MSFTAYPTGTDLINFLIGANVLTNPPSGSLAQVDYQGRIARAISKFESETGRVFLAQSATRIYDPPPNTRGILDLKGDLIQLTNVTAQGVTMVLNTDYYMGPTNNDQLNPPRPWTFIEFLNYFPSPAWPYLRHSIAVTGLWGFSVSIPADVWIGMVQLGALFCYPELALSISGGRESYELDGALKESYRTTLVKEAAFWKEGYENARLNNRRLTGML